MTALLIVIYSICGVYMLLNFKHDIQMLQQNSYRIKRYWNYLQNGDVNSLWRLSDVGMLFIICSRLLEVGVAAVFLGIFCLAKIILIQRRKFKKPLVFTKRVIRIYCVSGCIFVGLFLWAIFKLGFIPQTELFYTGPILTMGIFLFMSIFSWFIVMLGVILLIPVERFINRRFINDAKRILKNMPQLKVIGITGSYGKTSTKHYLERILSEKYDVLMTPGSYNTPMGVVRTIREMMKPYYSVFICEMGAKQKGDIKEICDIVHPEIGIVTAVGPMHLETFKSIENIRDTKFELIDSLPSNGFGIINKDFEECVKKDIKNVDFVFYTTSGSNIDSKDYVAKNINYTSDGTDFELLTPEGKELKFHTKLLGACNVSNLMAAIIVSLKMELSYEEISRGVDAIDQVEHRMSIKKTPGGITIIDDAFNSNPYGSRMALEVLSRFKEGRRIVVTPGMIELGEQQVMLNERLGEEIGKNSDIAIVVGEYNKKALIRGINNSDMDQENIISVDSFNEAQTELSRIVKRGDTILYENDLPDTFK